MPTTPKSSLTIYEKFWTDFADKLQLTLKSYTDRSEARFEDGVGRTIIIPGWFVNRFEEHELTMKPGYLYDES